MTQYSPPNSKNGEKSQTDEGISEVEYGGWTIDNSRQRLNRFCMAERISCDFENSVVQQQNGFGKKHVQTN